MVSIFDSLERDASSDWLYRYAHIAIIGIAVGTSLISIAKVAFFLFEHGSLFADFTVFWTAARFDDVYNARAITLAQQWILGPNPDLRPFAYPPSALLFLKPLQLLHYPSALALWLSAGIVCFGSSVWLYGQRALLAWLSPMVGLSIVIGQASLFTAAAIAAGVALLEKRPIVAGVLFGGIGAIKPQLAVLVPLALVCGHHWKALGAAMLVGATAVLLSLLLGAHLWVEWFDSIGGFLKQVQGAPFRRPDVAPGLIFAPIGVLSVVYVWTRTARAELRLLSLVGGTCLSVPYMMNYDLATMAIAAAVLLLDRDWRVWTIGFLAFAGFWLSPFIGAVGAVALSHRDNQWPVD